MGRYRKILVGFDGSLSSKNALRQAIKFARQEKCWIKALAVAPSYEGELELVGVRNMKEALRGPAERLLKEALEIAEAERASIMTGVEEGPPHERIVEVAQTENCDLIVVGRMGRGPLERTLLGSTAARVIGHSGKDVLIVPRNAQLSWESILLSIDGSRYSEAASRHAIDFARSYGGRISAVSVVDVTDEFIAEAPEILDKLLEKHRAILDGVRKEAEAAGLQVKTFLKEGDPSTKVLEVAGAEKAGVIFMGSHGRTGLMRLLMGSVTEKVIGYAPCPVIVVRPDGS